MCHSSLVILLAVEGGLTNEPTYNLMCDCLIVSSSILLLVLVKNDGRLILDNFCPHSV